MRTPVVDDPLFEEPAVRFGYADTLAGQLHYASAGPVDAPAVLLLHQTPRSWDEYRELLPLLGAGFRAIALDTPGMGASPPPAGEASIETYAAAAVALLDALGIERADVVGHHTGGVIAVEVAAAHPDRVGRMVLSSTPWVDAAAREARRSRPPIDAVATDEDGHHLTELWQRRQAFYPVGRPDILARFVADALRARDPEEGHLAVGRYEMERRLPLVQAPTLCLGASADPHAFPHLDNVAGRLGAEVAVIDGGMVPLMELHAPEVAAAVHRFLSGVPG